MAKGIQVFQRGGEDRKILVEKAATFFLKELVSTRMYNLLSIRIEMRVTKLSKDYEGSCYVPVNGSKITRSGVVILQRDMKRKEMLICLAHEMVHVAQMVTNRLQYTRKEGITFARWEGKAMGNIAHIPYQEHPWEVEAFTKQEELFQAFQAAQKAIGALSKQILVRL
jgi:hypothetical protein